VVEQVIQIPRPTCVREEERRLALEDYFAHGPGLPEQLA
jgi:hypothetical protein